uniref:NIPSNAP domain-containing protein n=1 Tax=Attheya septentrionalis TaxID=420275 RepID=A0A7S2U5K2_9STRA|mmetsp:Transcript_10897/g.19915  ORF Transcript_10897/g.19915 Transcript_10897/m.19915 type:complete len:274 (+) Transcript_10897:143-964(+)
MICSRRMIPNSSARRLCSQPSLIFERFSAVSMSSSSSPVQPIVELREYDLSVKDVKNYLKLTTEAADLRLYLMPLRMFSLPETGGKLHVATHAYYYEGGYAERGKRRATMENNLEWKKYVKNARPCMLSQKSNIFVEAPLVGTVEGVCGLKGIAHFPTQGNDCILEIRRYQLKLGYDTVPKFLSLYGGGLTSKLAAPGTDPTTSLVTLLYTEVGSLNEVIEIWRHGDGTGAMERSRHAARNAPEWRSAIAEIADLAVSFTSTIHKPTTFSPLG